MSSTSTAMDGSLTDAVSLTVGTPEHEAYYYDKLEKSLYNHINEVLEEFPDILLSRIWLSLGDAGQRKIFERMKRLLKYGHCRFDIEDQQRVDGIVSTLLAVILYELPDSEQELQKKVDSKNGQDEAKNPSVLNEPHRQRKIYSKNGKKKESNRLLKSAITRSHIEKAQKPSISSNPL